MIGDWEYQLENITIWFQGGVRKWIFISLGIMLVSCIPLYFIIAGINSAIFNTFSYNKDIVFRNKEVPEKPIEYSPTKVLNLKDGSKELYMLIDNKYNVEIGYYPFVFELVVQDKDGNTLYQKNHNTYLLPNDVRYISYRSTDPNATTLIIRKNENQTKKVYYNPYSNILKNPRIKVSNASFQVRSFTDLLYLNATIKNEEKITIKNIDLLLMVKNRSGNDIGLASYSVDLLNPLEQKEVGPIEYFQSENSDPVQVDVIWQVNYLDQKTFVY